MPEFVTALKSRFARAKIAFVTPWNVDALYFPEVIAAIKEATASAGVACYDAAALSGIQVNDAEFRKKYFQAPGDTAHLNYEGHGLMLEKVEPFLLAL